MREGRGDSADGHGADGPAGDAAERLESGVAHPFAGLPEDTRPRREQLHEAVAAALAAHREDLIALGAPGGLDPTATARAVVGRERGGDLPGEPAPEADGPELLGVDEAVALARALGADDDAAARRARAATSALARDEARDLFGCRDLFEVAARALARWAADPALGPAVGLGQVVVTLRLDAFDVEAGPALVALAREAAGPHDPLVLQEALRRRARPW